MNHVILIGNLGRDPEMRYAADGLGICTLSVATTEKFKDKTITEWHRCVLFGESATPVAEQLKKGMKVALSGKIKTHSWTNRDGKKQFSTQVVIDQIYSPEESPGNTQDSLLPNSDFDAGSF